jgi:hypothetical protein
MRFGLPGSYASGGVFIEKPRREESRIQCSSSQYHNPKCCATEKPVMDVNDIFQTSEFRTL